FQAEDGIRDRNVTGVQTCALPISNLRVWPATMTLSSSTMIGTLNPNSLILAATLSTASSLINLGLFSYSFNSDILIFVIFITSPPINSLSTSNTPSIIPTTCITRFVVNDAFQAIKIATPYNSVALISYIILFDTTNYSLYFVDFKYVPSVIFTS